MAHGVPMTPTQQLAEIKLGTPIDEWVAARRTSGDSWRTIARDLYTETGLVVSDETLRQWSQP
ncbi:MAG: hypothetical protein KA129_06425 [Microthrixaceae bacterium]|nr:hypothetical protein [Microthrixaceae bacterium]